MQAVRCNCFFSPSRLSGIEATKKFVEEKIPKSDSSFHLELDYPVGSKYVWKEGKV